MLPPEVQQLFSDAPGGLVPVRQIVKLGWDRREVAAWAALGLCTHPEYGLYGAPGPTPVTQHLHLPMAYLKQRAAPAHEEAALTGIAALEVYCVPGMRSRKPMVLTDVRCRARKKELPFTTRRVRLGDIVTEVIDGLRVAHPARALADAVVEGVSPPRLRAAVDHLRFAGLMTIPDAVRSWSGIRHRGARTLLSWARDGVFDQESEGERDAFRLLFSTRGVPKPDCQVYVLQRIRVDFAYLAAALIMEYHGEIHDGRADEDATRTHAIERAGGRVIVVTRSMLRQDASGLAAHIQTIRADREQRVTAGSLPRLIIPQQPERLTPLRTIHPAG